MSDSLTEHAAKSDPVAQFALWFDEAKQAGLHEPNAMALATASVTGVPSVRMVLLKEFNPAGFVFFTNYSSRKGHELEHNDAVALLFFWRSDSPGRNWQRQVRIEGRAAHTSRQESADYFRTRVRGAQIGAWASPQSEVVARDVLDQRVAELEAEYHEREVPVPPFWGGFRVVPSTFEFWQGRTHRLHDRLRYVREGASYRIERLAP